MKLGIVVGTIRQGRQTLKQANWVQKTAQQMEGVEVEIVDLADYPLPFFAEPVSPRYNPERKPEPAAQKWLDKIAEFDAYFFVTPEYNHSIPGVLKNAFDYFDWQMKRKPAAIVSHGTVGGARAAMHLKEIISEARAVPIPEFVALAHMSDVIDDDGNLSAEAAANPYGPQTALGNLLTELQWYSNALLTAK
ncbi:NAD(P)H-dependent oxidoreductase [Candidatus Saccharibacteria bacterium]|nr:NAD(P)H-dependent oxidoreductase [Candidatus Saccharibacteria bacterium]